LEEENFKLFLLKNFVFYGWIMPSASSSFFSPYFSDDTTLRLLLSYPLALVYGDYWAQTGNLSSLLLGCLPFVFLVPRRFWLERRQLLLLWVSCLCGLLVWLLIFPSVFQPRYMLLCLLLLGIPLLAAAAHYSRSSKLTAIMLPVLAACAIWVAYDAARKNGYISSSATTAYLKEKQPEAMVADFWKPMAQGQALLNEVAPKDARVYVAYYRYWLRPDLLQQAFPRRRSMEEIAEEGRLAKDKESFWMYMKKNNVTYLQYDFSSSAFLDPMLADLPPWVEVREIFSSLGGSAFRILQLQYH